MCHFKHRQQKQKTGTCKLPLLRTFGLKSKKETFRISKSDIKFQNDITGKGLICRTSLEMQITISIETTKHPLVLRRMEKIESHNFAGKDVTRYSHFEKQFGISSEVRKQAREESSVSKAQGSEFNPQDPH